MRLTRFPSTLISIALLIALLPTAQTARADDDNERTQKRLACLEENAIKFKSIKFAKRKHKDLMALKEKIGDARIVMLGEQTHGHGTSHKLKCRLIKFLHEEMDFNVLAWESHLTGCRQMDEAFLNDDSSQIWDLVNLGLYGVFSRSKDVFPLFEYIREKRGGENPIIQTGFDFQFSSIANKYSFAEFISDFFNSAHPGLLPNDKAKELDTLVSTTDFYSIRQSQVNKLLNMSDYLLKLFGDNIQLLNSHYPEKETAYLHRALLNLKEYTRYCSYFFASPRREPPMDCQRDKLMADTLIFLANEYYPDEKIIVWAATYHNMRNQHLIVVKQGFRRYGDYAIMGNYIHAEFGDGVYSIAPIAYEGWTEWANGYKYSIIPPAIEGSLSWYFHELGGKYYFLDMKSIRSTHWLYETLPARPLSSDEFMLSSWPQIVDAFVYIKYSEGCKDARKLP